MSAILGDEFEDAMDDAAGAELVSRADEQLLASGARALAHAIKLVSALLDPTEVVLGGPVVVLGDRFLALVREEVDYVATGTTAVSVRFADSRVDGAAGAAQFALSAALGVLWSPEQLVAVTTG